MKDVSRIGHLVGILYTAVSQVFMGWCVGTVQWFDVKVAPRFWTVFIYSGDLGRSLTAVTFQTETRQKSRKIA